MDKIEYLKSPCGVSSLPYWKTKTIRIPSGMRIIHNDDFSALQYENYTDELYFRLFHSLENVKKPSLPGGYSLCNAGINAYVQHINACYDDIGITESDLIEYTKRPLYVPAFWIAVKHLETGEIAATGIAELDQEIGEGVLEWIQVSKKYRKRGLATFLVQELLSRMKDSAKFATVSGKCKDSSCPEMLYRKCGFTGSDIWHILRLKSEDAI